MRSRTILHCPLSDLFMRFVIITAVAVVWCGLSIPVEGVVDKDSKENLEGVQNCLKAIQEVQEDPSNEKTVRRFIENCKEFIDKMDLSENQTAILEQAGYRRSTKSKSKIEKNEIEDNEVTEEKDTTENSGQKVTPHEKDHAKDPTTLDKDDGNNQEVPSAETLEADVHDNITQKEDGAMKKKDIKQRKLKPKMKKPLKEAPKPKAETLSQKDEAEKTEIPSQEEKKSEHEKVAPTESEHEKVTPTAPKHEKVAPTAPEHEKVAPAESKQPYAKSQEKQIPQNEQVQYQNPQADLPPFDFSKFEIPGMTPEELEKAVEEFRELQRILRMQQASQPEVHMHANFPDPASQGMHESQFGHGIPQFQHQEWNAQFQQFQQPAFAAGVPDPMFQQNIPPFPQQADFAGHFQHQHFDQGIPQMPPAPEWDPAFHDQKFGQGIPQPNNDAAAGNTVNEAFQVPDQHDTIQPSNVVPADEEPSSKRQVDEL